jgi:hypothetical protein
MMAQTVVAVFDTHAAAIRGVDELRHANFQAQQISILAPDPREAEGYADELGVRVIRAGSVGIAAGGVLGGLAGWLVGLTGLLIPGAGIVLAAGPFAVALVAAVGGASLGGFMGTLVGLGLPHHAAEEFERALREGQTLVVVHPRGNFIGAEVALNRAQPVGLHHYAEPIGAENTFDSAPSSSAAATDPLGRIALASPDHALPSADVSEQSEGQQSMYPDEAELHPIGGRADT